MWASSRKLKGNEAWKKTMHLIPFTVHHGPPPPLLLLLCKKVATNYCCVDNDIQNGLYPCRIISPKKFNVLENRIHRSGMTLQSKFTKKGRFMDHFDPRHIHIPHKILSHTIICFPLQSTSMILKPRMLFRFVHDNPIFWT